MRGLNGVDTSSCTLFFQYYSISISQSKFTRAAHPSFYISSPFRPHRGVFTWPEEDAKTKRPFNRADQELKTKQRL